MPAIVTCAGCGYIFLSVKELPKGDCFRTGTWYNALYRKMRGKCPNCNHQLPEPKHYGEKMSVSVTPLEMMKK